jgi:uncharacterized protein (TIGR00661 family)
MKALFVVSGIGYGDATREHANIIEFRKKFPNAKIMVAGYDNSYDYFKDKYKTIKIRGYKLPGSAMRVNVFTFGLRNLFLPAFWFFSTLKVRLQAFRFIPDLVVSDFEPAGISLARVLRKKCVVVFGYDPLLFKEYCKNHKVNYKMRVEALYFEKLYNQADVVVIPTFRKEKKHLLYNYIEPIVRVKPDELASEKVLMRELKLEKKPFVVMLGGSDFGEKLARNLNKVAKSYPNEEFIIFGGDLDLNLNENVKYIRYTPDFLKYLKVSKGVVTLAGQKTLSEAVVFGKPILCFPIQDHVEQVLNAYALEGKVIVGHDSSYFGVHYKFREFLDKLPEITKNVKKMKGEGSKQFVKIIEAIMKV